LSASIVVVIIIIIIYYLSRFNSVLHSQKVLTCLFHVLLFIYVLNVITVM